jgi:hypothetical protein
MQAVTEWLQTLQLEEQMVEKARKKWQVKADCRRVAAAAGAELRVP